MAQHFLLSRQAKTLNLASIFKMTAEGIAMFPTYEGLVGELEGYDRVGLARVRFDGRTGVIHLDSSFIEETDTPFGQHNDRRYARAKRHNKLIEKRKLLHAAFLLVRKDPNQKDLMRKFVAALAGREPITDELLDQAQQTVISPPVGVT